MAYFLSLKILTRRFYQGNLIHLFSEILILTINLKIHPKWVKSGDFGFNLMKYWLKSPVFTHKVGLLIKCHVLTDSATWNPGIIQNNTYNMIEVAEIPPHTQEIQQIKDLVDKGVSRGFVSQYNQEGYLTRTDEAEVQPPEFVGTFSFSEMDQDGDESPFDVQEDDIVIKISSHIAPMDGQKSDPNGQWEHKYSYRIVSPKRGDVRIVEDLLNPEREPADRQRSVESKLEEQEKGVVANDIKVILRGSAG